MTDKKKSTRKTSDTSTSHRASQKQKVKPPKRNKSAFILFSQDRRPQLKKELNLNSNEMMVELGKLWRDSDPEVREDYEKRATDDKERYTKELEEFTKKYPAKLVHNKTKKNHVKKACSAYAVFLKETLDAVRQENPDLKMADLLKIFSLKWKEMPEEDKKKYQKKAKKEQDSVKKQKSGKKGTQKSQRRGRKPKLVKREQDTPSPSTIIQEDEEEEQETIYSGSFEKEEAPAQKRVKIGDSVPVLMELECIDNYFLSPTTESDESCQLKIDFDSLMTSPLQMENLDMLSLEKDDDFMFAEVIKCKPAFEVESKLFDLHTFDYQQTSMVFKNTEELPFLNNLGSLFRSRCFSDKMEVQAQSKSNVYNQLITDLLPQDQESLILPIL